MEFLFWIIEQAHDFYLGAFIVLLISLVASTALAIEEILKRD